VVRIRIHTASGALRCLVISDIVCCYLRAICVHRRRLCNTTGVKRLINKQKTITNKLLHNWQQQAAPLPPPSKQPWNTLDIPDTSQWARRCPKIASFHGGIQARTNTWFLGPTQVHIPNSISTASAVLAQLIVVTTTQRPHAPVAVGCILHSVHAMWPKNWLRH